MPSKPLKREFPLVPKSTRFLEPGDFWAIPLEDGSFGCGRIVELAPLSLPSGSRSFLGALLNWHGPDPPTSDSIAGCHALKQGVMHLLAVTKTGGAILGARDPRLDKLEPWTFIHGNAIQRGFTPIKPFVPRSDYPTLSWWGYDVISIYAHKMLLGVVPRDA